MRFEWFQAEQRERLLQIAHLPAEAEERTVDDFQNARREGWVTFEAEFDLPRIDLRLPRQSQHFEGDSGE